MKSHFFVVALLCLLAFRSAWAGPVIVTNAWVRATVPGQEVAGAYMEITSGYAARLVAARSPITPRVEVHAMQMDGNIMRMRGAQTIELPKNGVVVLKPGGYHIMLMKLKKPINAGDKIPLTLIVETAGKREKVAIEAIARSPIGEADPGHDHMHH